MIKWAIQILSVLFFFCSCGIKENSEKAVENAAIAAENSGNAAKSSYKAASASEILYYSAQAGGAEESMKMAIRDMRDSKGFDLKARFAGSFIKSLSHQTLMDIANRKFVNLDEYYEYKLTDDIKSIRRLATEFLDPKRKFKVAETKGDAGNLKALASALHLKNPLCRTVPELRGRCQSPLDVIHRAFTDYYQNNTRFENLKAHQKIIIREKEVFLTLSELRVKFLPLIALSKVSKLNDGLLSTIKMYIGKWSPGFLGNSFADRQAVENIESESEQREKISELEKIVALAQGELAQTLLQIEARREQGKRPGLRLKRRQASAKRNLTKQKRRLQKATKALQKLLTKNKKAFEKAIERDRETQKKMYGDWTPGTANIDFFGLVKDQVVTERDFLRGMKIVVGQAPYQKVIPLRYAEMPNLVRKIIDNMDLNQIETLNINALEGRDITANDLSDFKRQLEDLRVEADYNEGDS